ncbi:hypothetical protein E7Z53_11530 [Kocuria salina]|uniref:hypothetical protein n=1 Tax=Kocuria salina TaxID=1929416 RepID=UPI001593B909|nr:hypothetical protein [Kocuria salina]NVC24063.1 hypothetical protein [Kocuria salina]
MTKTLIPNIDEQGNFTSPQVLQQLDARYASAGTTTTTVDSVVAAQGAHYIYGTTEPAETTYTTAEGATYPVVWVAPGAGTAPSTVPLVSPLDTDSDLMARWEIARHNGTAGTPVTSLNRTAGTWAAAALTGANGPTFTTGAINGRPALRFDGIDDHLDLDHADLTGPTTFIAVAKLNTYGTGRLVSSISGTSYRMIRTSSSADQLGILTNGTNTSLYAPWNLSTGWMIVVAVVDTTSRLYLNTRTPLTGAGPALTTQADLRLGRGSGTSTQYTDMELADLAILNRGISDYDAQRFIDELTAKYKISMGA